MAKMIKCPTCGTQIEVQSADGQVIRCPGCGKGLKLVAKKPPGAAPARDAGSSQGSMAAMTFHGEVPPQNDMPSLEAKCDVCGRPTDPEKLIEDNGRMICPDCEKGARSRIDRPVGGAATLEFKPAVPAPMKRGRAINLSPAFFAACLAALVWAGAHTYLTLVEKPQGTGPGLAKANIPPDPGPPTVSPPEPGPEVAPPPTPTPDTPLPEPPVLPDPQEKVAVTDPPATLPEPVTTRPTEVAAGPPQSPTTQGSILFPQDDLPPPDAAPVMPDPEPVVAGDSIDRGLALLREQNYTAALREFDDARRKYLVGAGTGELTPEQAVTLNGLAAAYMGTGRADQLEVAEGLLTTAIKRGDHSRALAMNRAIIAMRRNPTFQRLGVAANDLKAYLDTQPGDEYAAEIFGTLLARATSMPNAPKDKIEPFWEYLDKYNDEIARSRGETGKLKWGVDWLPAEDVMRFRQARAAGNSVSVTVTEAARQLEAARARLKSAQAALTKAQSGRGDVIGAQRAVDASTEAVLEAEKMVQATAATMTPPKWLEKFEPVIPVRE